MATARSKSPGANSGTGTQSSVTSGTCVISQDTRMEGTFRSQSDVRMDGFIQGDVHCGKRLVMGQSGQIKGTIVAHNAVIMGKVEGELEVKDTLHLKATAVINGDIRAKIMTVEEGAEFNGECRIGVVSQ